MPYVYLQEPPFIDREVTKTGKIVYKGFCIELLNRLQQDMKFKYTIEVVPRNIYGSWDLFNQKWSGMMEYLVERVSVCFTDYGLRNVINKLTLPKLITDRVPEARLVL